MRKNAREDAFRLIFEQYINKGESEEQLQRYFSVVEAERAEEEPLFVNKPTKQDNDYVRQIVEGVTANLGLSPLIHAVSAVVEALRSNTYDNLEEQYEEVVAQMARVKDLKD